MGLWGGGLVAAALALVNRPAKGDCRFGGVCGRRNPGGGELEVGALCRAFDVRACVCPQLGGRCIMDSRRSVRTVAVSAPLGPAPKHPPCAGRQWRPSRGRLRPRAQRRVSRRRRTTPRRQASPPLRHCRNWRRRRTWRRMTRRWTGPRAMGRRSSRRWANSRTARDRSWLQARNRPEARLAAAADFRDRRQGHQRQLPGIVGAGPFVSLPPRVHASDGATDWKPLDNNMFIAKF